MLIPGRCAVRQKSQTKTGVNAYNQLYFQNDTLISNRPLYISSDGMFAIWFNGEEWLHGKMRNFVGRKVPMKRSMRSNEFTDCPSSSKRWEQFVDGRMVFYANLVIQCSVVGSGSGFGSGSGN